MPSSPQPHSSWGEEGGGVVYQIIIYKNGSLKKDWGKTTSFVGLHYHMPMQNIGSIILVYYAVFVSLN